MKRYTALMILCAALLAAGCGDVSEGGAGAASPETAAAASSAAETSAAETTPTETTTTAETATTTASTTAPAEAETTAETAAETTYVEHGHSPEDMGDELFQALRGDWYSDATDETLHVGDGRFTLERAGETITGTLLYDKNVIVDALILKPETGTLLGTAYIYLAPDNYESLIMNEESRDFMPTFKYLGSFTAEISSDGTDQVIVGSYSGDDSEYAVRVVLTAKEPVTNFQLLKLEMREGFDDPVGLPFSAAVIDEVPAINAGESYAAIVSFPGDTPPYGYRYTDADGVMHQFELGLSGKDGGLYASAF